MAAVLLALLALAEPTAGTAGAHFQVFWNVPSAECDQFGVQLDPSQFGFTVNAEQRFAGDQIVLLYAPGLFPQILANGTHVNGGLPQLGRLDVHLDRLRVDIDAAAPDAEFAGLAVIDFESWTPWFAEAPQPYHDAAYKLVRRRHPHWSDDRVTEQAREDFEWWARLFLERTLQAARAARPSATWGYYQYPLCKNLGVENGTCPASVRDRNDRLSWLFGASDALFPSVYLFRDGFSDAARRATVRGRLDEALRQAAGLPVYPYTWFQYHDDPGYLTEEDLVSMLGQIRTRGLPGAVLWGSTANCDTAAQCRRLAAYLDTSLGPLVRRLVSLTPAQTRSWSRLLTTRRGRRLLLRSVKRRGHGAGRRVPSEWEARPDSGWQEPGARWSVGGREEPGARWSVGGREEPGVHWSVGGREEPGVHWSVGGREEPGARWSVGGREGPAGQRPPGSLRQPAPLRGASPDSARDVRRPLWPGPEVEVIRAAWDHRQGPELYQAQEHYGPWAVAPVDGADARLEAEWTPLALD